jgi:hypothetical protein
MQIGVTGISVPYKRFVVASTCAQRTRETTVTIVLAFDVAAIQERMLLGFVDAGIHVSERVRIGIHEPMARCDIARRSDAH